VRCVCVRVRARALVREREREREKIIKTTGVYTMNAISMRITKVLPRRNTEGITSCERVKMGKDSKHSRRSLSPPDFPRMVKYSSSSEYRRVCRSACFHPSEKTSKHFTHLHRNPYNPHLALSSTA